MHLLKHLICAVLLIVAGAVPVAGQTHAIDIRLNQPSLLGNSPGTLIASLSPAVQDFGLVGVGGPPVIRYDTIRNLGTLPLPIVGITLKFGPQYSGFTIDSAVTDTLAVGETRLFKISFIPDPHQSSDTIVLQTCCSYYTAAVSGRWDILDISQSSVDFGPIMLGDSTITPPNSLTIRNTSTQRLITIDSIWSDWPDYTFIGTVPFTLLPRKDTFVIFQFKPSIVSPVTADWYVVSHTIGYDGKPLGARHAYLQGSGIASTASVPSESKSAPALLYQSLNRYVPSLPSTWAGFVTLDISNLLGVKVFHNTFEASSRAPIDLGNLAADAYFYRLTCGSESAAGKVVIR